MEEIIKDIKTREREYHLHELETLDSDEE